MTRVFTSLVLFSCLLGLGTIRLYGQVDTTRQQTPLLNAPASGDTLKQSTPKAQPQEAKEEGGSGFPLDNFYAEIKKRPRSIFSHFRFGLSTGYGNNFFSHDLQGYGIYQAPGGAPEIFPVGVTSTRYSNWVNERVLSTSAANPAAFLVASDTASLGFTGNAMSIPIKATIHYEFKHRYRIGIGYSFEYMSMGNFTPKTYSDRLTAMKPSNPSGMMSRFFGLLGVSFYRAGDYLFTGDLQVGSFSPSNFDMSLATTNVYINGGVTIERELSEYLTVFARPSYEFKSYTLNLPEGGSAISHGMNALFLNIGLTYRIPELPKCFNKDCRIQINHAHGDKEYRSRVHPIYKKQNPHYGENHPNLIKYKGKNKKMLNPY